MKAYPQIDALLDQTENAQRCAHSSDPLIQKGLYRRYRAGDLARPYPGLFARAEYWNQLNEPEQSLHAARTLSRLHPQLGFRRNNSRRSPRIRPPAIPAPARTDHNIAQSRIIPAARQTQYHLQPISQRKCGTRKRNPCH